MNENIFLASVCYTCKNLGDIANLMFCSTCGTHYHGTCVGLAQMPGIYSYIKQSYIFLNCDIPVYVFFQDELHKQ